MREFLFRGKRTDCEAWVEGDLLHYESGEMAICKGFSNYGYEATEIIGRYKVIPETVGQYTGLTDKNGTKIFEGDIVECVSDGEQAVISWLKYFACFGLSFDGWCRGFDNYDDNLPSDFEVIGNIHDNPDILKGGGDNG